MKPSTVFYLNHTAKLSGGEIALARTLAALDRERVTPVVILAEDGPLVERLEQLGIETQVLPLSREIREIRKDSLRAGMVTKFRAILLLFSYAASIARLARARQVSILHTNSLKADIYGALAGRLAGIPVVWHVRDHINPSYLPAPAVLLFRLLARVLPSFVLSNSQSTERSLHLPATTRKAVVYDGLGADDLAGLAPKSSPATSRTSKLASQAELTSRVNQGSGAELTSQAEEGSGVEQDIETHQAITDIKVSDPVFVGIVGRLAPWKGQHIFLEAASRLLAAGCQARFIVVGSPLFGEADYEAKLRQQALSLGISDAVEFQGFRTDMPAALHQLDILVHASIIPEPFGQVVIEGMAAGLPVIATDGGGVREIIQHGKTGLLIPMADPEAMAGAIRELIENSSQAQWMAEAGRHHVGENFTARLTARRLEGIYRKLLPGNHKP